MLGATRGMLEAIGRETFDLPDGFEKAYSPETASSDD